MNKRTWLLGIILTFLSLFFQNVWADRILNLYVGQVRPINLGEVERVAVGKDSILQTVVLDDGKVLFIPTSEGETDVKIWLKNGSAINYKFKVLAENMASRKVIAQSLLRSFPSLKVTSVDKHIIVEGKISPVDQKIYQTVISNIKNVVSLVNPNKFNEYQIRKLMQGFGIDAIQIKRAGNRFIISGEIDEKDLKTFEEVVTKIPNISSIVRPKLFSKEKMVRLKVHVAEIDSNFGRQLGIQWQDNAAGPTFTAATPIIKNDRFGVVPSPGDVNGVDFVDILSSAPNEFSLDLRFATNITSRLNFLETNGRARTLSRPELLARSGEDAKFHVGGELPIVFTDSNGQTQVIYKPYGVQVDMKPLINRNNEIVLSLTAEVSSVDTSVSVLGVPGLRNTRATTNINASHGSTIAIAGLLDVSGGNDTAKIPYLGNIPVLGNFFKTKGLNFSKRELIVLVTPELINSKNFNNASQDIRDEIKNLEVFQVPLDRDVKGSSYITDILE